MVATHPPPLFQGVSLIQRNEGVKYRGMQVVLIAVHFFDLHNTYLPRNACGHQQNTAHVYIPRDKRWEHLHPHAMPAFFTSQNPFMRLESMLEVLYQQLLVSRAGLIHKMNHLIGMLSSSRLDKLLRSKYTSSLKKRFKRILLYSNTLE